ncbi:MAG: hypothetical protein BRD51_01580 [Bacteroidetes bacterium SW_11_64_17]|nr:MAG: hypothetical protein BRD51_01580 [Bacteroidetes bacterium SW_11_64_17]
MIVRSLLLFVLGGGLGLTGVVPGGQAQAPEGTAAAWTTLARYKDAQALAADPRGRLYVADAGRDVVEILDAEGKPQDMIGGSGTRAGEFDVPSDVDPTNGQLLLVADTYNGRLQRFSEEGQYLESLAIGRPDRRAGDGWRFENRREGDPVRSDGRPIAVARDDDQSIFILDERGRQLLKWTDLGGAERIVGGGARLQDPVALAIGDRRVPVPPLPNVQALVVHRGRLHIVSADTVRIWDQSNAQMTEHSVDLPKPLVDVARSDGDVYVLTESRLLRKHGW